MKPDECIPGTTVWAPLGSSGWRPAVVIGAFRDRIKLTFESGMRSNGSRPADCLRPRDRQKFGDDKPTKLQAVATCSRRRRMAA
jgi:hypothetical protein